MRDMLPCERTFLNEALHKEQVRLQFMRSKRPRGTPVKELEPETTEGGAEEADPGDPEKAEDEITLSSPEAGLTQHPLGEEGLLNFVGEVIDEAEKARRKAEKDPDRPRFLPSGDVNLFRYQEVRVAKVLDHYLRSPIEWDVSSTGYGKTYLGTGIGQRLRTHVLVICPLQVEGTWINVLKKGIVARGLTAYITTHNNFIMGTRRDNVTKEIIDVGTGEEVYLEDENGKAFPAGGLFTREKLFKTSGSEEKIPAFKLRPWFHRFLREESWLIIVDEIHKFRRRNLGNAALRSLIRPIMACETPSKILFLGAIPVAKDTDIYNYMWMMDYVQSRFRYATTPQGDAMRVGLGELLFTLTYYDYLNRSDMKDRGWWVAEQIANELYIDDGGYPLGNLNSKRVSANINYAMSSCIKEATFGQMERPRYLMGNAKYYVRNAFILLNDKDKRGNGITDYVSMEEVVKTLNNASGNFSELARQKKLLPTITGALSKAEDAIAPSMARLVIETLGNVANSKVVVLLSKIDAVFIMLHELYRGAVADYVDTPGREPKDFLLGSFLGKYLQENINEYRDKYPEASNDDIYDHLTSKASLDEYATGAFIPLSVGSASLTEFGVRTTAKGAKGMVSGFRGLFNDNDDRFRVIVGTVATMGIGVDLHDANRNGLKEPAEKWDKVLRPRFLFMVPIYSLIDVGQAIGRIYRTGSLSNAFALIVYGVGKANMSKVLDSLRKKTTTAKLMISATGDTGVALPGEDLPLWQELFDDDEGAIPNNAVLQKAMTTGEYGMDIYGGNSDPDQYTTYISKKKLFEPDTLDVFTIATKKGLREDYLDDEGGGDDELNNYEKKFGKPSSGGGRRGSAPPGYQPERFSGGRGRGRGFQ